MAKHCSNIPQARSARDNALAELTAHLFAKVAAGEITAEDAQRQLEAFFTPTRA